MAQPQQTHCLRGHEFAGDNLLVLASGERRCRACERIRQAHWKQGGRSEGSDLSRKAATCRRGHPLSGANLQLLSSGERRCRACERIRRERYYQGRLARGLRRSPKQQSNREMYRRRHLRAEIAALIDSDVDQDPVDLLPEMAERLGLSLSTCQFELRWQLGFYDMDEEERG